MTAEVPMAPCPWCDDGEPHPDCPGCDRAGHCCLCGGTARVPADDPEADPDAEVRP